MAPSLEAVESPPSGENSTRLLQFLDKVYTDGDFLSGLLDALIDDKAKPYLIQHDLLLDEQDVHALGGRMNTGPNFDIRLAGGVYTIPTGEPICEVMVDSATSHIYVDGLQVEKYSIDNNGLITFSTSTGLNFEIKFEFPESPPSSKLEAIEHSLSGHVWQAGVDEAQKVPISGNRYYPEDDPADAAVRASFFLGEGPDIEAPDIPGPERYKRILAAREKTATANLSTMMDFLSTRPRQSEGLPPATVFAVTDGKGDFILAGLHAVIGLAATAAVFPATGLLGAAAIFLTLENATFRNTAVNQLKAKIIAKFEKDLRYLVATEEVPLDNFSDKVKTIIDDVPEDLLDNTRTRQELFDKAKEAYIKTAEDLLKETVAKDSPIFKWSWKKAFKESYREFLEAKFTREVESGHLEKLIDAYIAARKPNPYQEQIEDLQEELRQSKVEENDQYDEPTPVDESNRPAGASGEEDVRNQHLEDLAAIRVEQERSRVERREQERKKLPTVDEARETMERRRRERYERELRKPDKELRRGHK